MIDYWEIAKIVGLFIPLIALIIYFFGYLKVSYEEIFLRYYRKIDRYDILNHGVKIFSIFITIPLLVFFFLTIIKLFNKSKEEISLSFVIIYILIFLYYSIAVIVYYYLNKELDSIEKVIVKRGWDLRDKKVLNETDGIIYLSCLRATLFNYLPVFLIIILFIPVILFLLPESLSNSLLFFEEFIIYIVFLWLAIFITYIFLIVKHEAFNNLFLIFIDLCIDRRKVEKTKVPFIEKGKISGILAKETDNEYIIYNRNDKTNEEYSYVVRKDYVISCVNTGIEIKIKRK